MCGQEVWTNGEAAQKRKKRIGKREAQTRQFSKNERHLLCWTGGWRIQRNHWGCEEKVGCAYGRGYAAQKEKKKPDQLTGSGAECISQGFKTDERWKLKNLLGKKWNHLYLKIRKTTLQAKDTTQWTTLMWYTSFPMPQTMEIPDAKAAVVQEWKKFETIPAWDLESQEQKRRLFWKLKETKRKSTLPHWWTYVTSKCGVGITITEV